MPALGCCVDAAVAPPAYANSPLGSLPAPPPLPLSFISGAPPPTPMSPTSASAGSVAADVDASHWSPSHSASLYKIDSWGAPYFAVNPSGNVSVRPYGHATLAHQEIDLLKIVKKVSDPKSVGGLGLQLPLIVRLPDVLRDRLESLQSAFEFAIQTQGYEARYQGVFPVKCNQDRFVVEDIVKFGSQFRFGLEAGSKPELLLAMSCLCKGSPEALLVCNGFKDAEYITLSLLARKLDLNAVIVLEQEEEVDLVIEISKKLNVRPVIGARAKLRTKHSGHFGSTSGEKGKFGLTTTQILRVVKKLEVAEMLDCFQLLHFHIGSQIPSTALLTDGVGEAAQIYCELVRLGANMQVIDIGGGLGIDYDGSKSADSDLSVAYTLEEYASAVVQAIRYVCDRKNVKHPVLCSESGRAIVSHHSILIFEAVSASVSRAAPVAMSPLGLQYLVEGLTEDARSDYTKMTTAALRAMEIGASDPVRTYHVNLSIFTSIPDYWAIGQLFPIVPIHHLDERPGVRGVLSDLTCDSDGKIDKFIGGGTSLPLHEMVGGGCGERGPYYLGMFLGGAYEEALGGVHNLFGGPSVVRVLQSDGPHSFAVTRAMPGPSCGDVLRVMQHEPELMFETLKHRAEEYCGQEHGSNGGDGDTDDYDHGMANNSALASSLAQYFHSMPYLVVPSSCSLTAINNGGGLYYCNGEDYDAVVDSSPNEDEQWSYCYA
ncbi:Arginine decarboxylase 2 [Citrus sinensis]|uniref:Arginine decarboxylase 2 n=1 Tax=Citrus sinensis TaxID=2711 RepID=A0ACB8II57_CITSI|nr:Arginine decarboxylase 2 [Citrus sinensis]